MQILNVLDRKAFILQGIERGRANQGTTMYLSVVHKQANDDKIHRVKNYCKVGMVFTKLLNHSKPWRNIALLKKIRNMRLLSPTPSEQCYHETSRKPAKKN